MSALLCIDGRPFARAATLSEAHARLTLGLGLVSIGRQQPRATRLATFSVDLETELATPTSVPSAPES